MPVCQHPVEGNLALTVPVRRTRSSFDVVYGSRSGHSNSPHAIAHHMPAERSAQRVRTMPRVWAGVIVVLLFALLALCTWSVVQSRAAEHAAAVSSVATEMVTVQPGDSIWTLAQAHGIDSMTTQETSEVILDLNDLESAMLQPGMELKVPA